MANSGIILSTFIYHNKILNRHGLPYIPQLFALVVKERKGPGDEDDKRAEASNEWFFVIYLVLLLSDLNF